MAKSAPKSEKIRAWLSLDGKPKNQAKTPKNTTVIKHERQITDAPRLDETFAIENIVFATLAPVSDEIKTPKKLKMLDRSAPCQSFKVPELTIEKIEFGASVQPFTKTTDKASKNVKKSRGVSIFAKKFIENLPVMTLKTDMLCGKTVPFT